MNHRAPYIRIAMTSAIAVAVSGLAAQAAPIQFGTGNYYELIEVADPYTGTNNSWDTAKAAAAAVAYLTVNGHLATVTSQAENNFLFGLVAGLHPAGPNALTSFTGAWLGGNSVEWKVGPEAGQALTYTNWGSSEPNNGGGPLALNYAYMNIGADLGKQHPVWHVGG